MFQRTISAKKTTDAYWIDDTRYKLVPYSKYVLFFSFFFLFLFFLSLFRCLARCLCVYECIDSLWNSWAFLTLYVKNQHKKKTKNKIENYHGSDTIFLVGVLTSAVGFVFVTFTLMALCYRSVVVHQNFTMCIRLVFHSMSPA